MRMNSQEKKWVVYDVGNSAFTLLVSTILPIYFNYLAGQAGISSADYMVYWGYAASIVTLIVALSGPILGASADKKGRKKPLFMAAVLVGAVCCVAMGFARQWLLFLIIFVVAKTGYSISLIFYDSMLLDVTEEERMDHVSSQGFAWGYIGSCVPFVICLALVLGADFIGISMPTAMAFSFLIVALWWIGGTIPLVSSYKQKFFISEKEEKQGNLKSVWRTLKEIAGNRRIFFFLLAYFFYIDGVYTIIDMATAYGTALGLDSTGLLLALLATQVVAFPSAIVIGKLAQRIASEKLICICIAAYFCIAVFAVFISTQAQFWILAITVGMFQGGIQALSRSYFAKIIPATKSGEYFGILDICGKGAAFMGTTVISIVTQITGSVNIGVGAIAILFIVGMLLFLMAGRDRSFVAVEKAEPELNR